MATHPGVYCLRSSETDWDEDALWRTYTTLTDVEAVFRSLKSELGLRPIYHHYHHKPRRADGHLFLTVIAYQRGFAVHSINPKQLDRFRDRLSPAGAKDDRRDARVLASALRTDPHCLRRLEPTDPAIVELREWSRLSEELTRERVRLANRMRDQLWRYYPQFLDAVDDDVAAPWALDLWQSLPTPRAGQRVREVTLTRVLKQHRIRRIDTATLRARLRAPAIKLTPGAAEAAVTHVRLVAERLALVNRQLEHVRRELDGLVHQLAQAAPTHQRPVGADSRRHRRSSGRPACGRRPARLSTSTVVPSGRVNRSVALGFRLRKALIPLAIARVALLPRTMARIAPPSRCPLFSLRRSTDAV